MDVEEHVYLSGSYVIPSGSRCGLTSGHSGLPQKNRLKI
jgi:hypothetical protein